MEYNTDRENLILPEYGRYIQGMVKELMLIPEKDKRTAFAYKVIKLMGLLGPSQKENDEFRQRLWGHLFALSNFTLDVDAPYPLSRPVPTEKSQRPKYSGSNIKIKSYGKYISEMILNAANQPDSPGRDTYINNIASFMKMMHRQWQDDKVPDAVICQSVYSISKGAIKIESFTDVHGHSDQSQLNVARTPIVNGSRPQGANKKKKKKKKIQ